MSRGKDLMKNTGILMVAKISTQVVSFLLLPLYTALLTTQEYGRIDIYTSLSMIVIPFLTLQVEMALFRFFITEKDRFQRKEVVSCSYALILSVISITALIYVLVSGLLSLQYRWLLLAYYVSQAMSSVFLQTCRAKGDNVGYGVSSFISSALAVGLNVLFVAVFQWKVEGILTATVLAQTCSCVYALLRTKIYELVDFRAFRVERCKELLEYAVPLVFNQVASWAVNNSNRLIIVAHLGEGANGIFSVASKFSNIIGTFFNVYNVAWTENIVRSMADSDGERYISKAFNLSISAYMALTTGVLNLLPFVFHMLVNETYNDAYLHVPMLLIGMLFSGMSANVGSIYVAYKKTTEVTLTTALAGVCNVAVHFVLLRKLGLFAASIATLVSFVALFIYRVAFVKKFFRLKCWEAKTTLQFGALIISWIAFSVRNTVLILLGLMLNILCIVIVFFPFRDAIKNIFRKGKF